MLVTFWLEIHILNHPIVYFILLYRRLFMNHPKFDFALLGGDMRQIYMANEFIARDYSVIAFGLKDPLLDSVCYTTNSLSEALNNCQNLLTPIPMSKDRCHITAIEEVNDLTIDNLCSLLTPMHKLYGGCFPAELKNYCYTNHIPFYDFMEQEEVILYNTIATAEGAIAEAINNSDINLHGSSCLIIGYGRCARTLADKLKGLCKHIDIAARSPIALAEACTSSYGTLFISELKEEINRYDFIFNTVPSLILTKDLLIETKSDVWIIDIASAPGGVDYQAAKILEKNCKLCLGLPGKYAPKSSAVFLVDHVLSNVGKKC